MSWIIPKCLQSTEQFLTAPIAEHIYNRQHRTNGCTSQSKVVHKAKTTNRMHTKEFWHYGTLYKYIKLGPLALTRATFALPSCSRLWLKDLPIAFQSFWVLWGRLCSIGHSELNRTKLQKYVTRKSWGNSLNSKFHAILRGALLAYSATFILVVFAGSRNLQVLHSKIDCLKLQ